MRALPLPDRPCATPLLENRAQRSTKKPTVPGNSDNEKLN